MDTFSSFPTRIHHGFVVQYSVIPLDLSPSKNYNPVKFIKTEDDYVKDSQKFSKKDTVNPLDRTSVIFWEYFDEDRKNFENNLFTHYEQKSFDLQKQNEPERIKNYLKLCKVMCRCSDPDEAIRIHQLLIDLILLKDNNYSLLVDLLQTVCVTNEMIFHILTTTNNEKYLDTLLLSFRKIGYNDWGLWPGTYGFLTDNNLISQHFFIKFYNVIPILLKHGLQWAFCDDVYVNYCKALNSSCKSTEVSCTVAIHIHRFIVQRHALLLGADGYSNMEIPAELVTLLGSDHPETVRYEGMVAERGFNIGRKSSELDDTSDQYEESAHKSYHRFFLILQVYFTIRSWLQNGTQDTLDALQLLWRSIPDAYITHHELLTSIQNFASPPVGQELTDVCDSYFCIFWNGCSEPSAPRSLTDLCRCSIRNRLSENFKLPEGISQLNIPPTIERFLRLEV